jgi:Domain of unknown function (DUF5664)
MHNPAFDPDEQNPEVAAGKFVTRDSGAKTVHSDGVQRDTQQGKTLFPLMFPRGVPMAEQLIVRVAELYTRGAEKYGDRNWEASGAEDTLDHHTEALWRHFMNFVFEVQDGEDHAAAVVWNINAIEQTRRNLAAMEQDRELDEQQDERASALEFTQVNVWFDAGETKYLNGNKITNTDGFGHLLCFPALLGAQMEVRNDPPPGAARGVRFTAFPPGHRGPELLPCIQCGQPACIAGQAMCSDCMAAAPVRPLADVPLSEPRAFPIEHPEQLSAAVQKLLKRSCPDDGTCHHECNLGAPCFRVLTCGPLSGKFPDDQWPEDVWRVHRARDAARDLQTMTGEVWCGHQCIPGGTPHQHSTADPCRECPDGP